MSSLKSSQIIQNIRLNHPHFDHSYLIYSNQIAEWRKTGIWKDEYVQDKVVLDWECGRGVFAAIFLELGAKQVIGIDSWLEIDYSSQVLSFLPNSKFEKISIKEFEAHYPHKFDLIFANTVTEHLADLPQQFSVCYRLLNSGGVFLNNHDNYYQPVGSHDHGFLFYGENNQIVTKSPPCWSDPRKCAISIDFRQSIMQNLPWTWDKRIESFLDPEHCDECPYYKRSQPWAHLIYQQDFRRVFSQPCFTTGYPESSLNKVTPFQLRQYLIEAGFDIELWQPNQVINEPPDFLTKPPYSFQKSDLTTCTITAVCRNSQNFLANRSKADQVLISKAQELAKTEKHQSYEHLLQSQDLMTRHWVGLTFNNILDIIRHPSKVKRKLSRWIRYRIQGHRDNS